ncbi:hypothetical protein A2U01_0029781 [Trifolium medium]|uniref:Uncharacterized protein n=1 Tax=Trifolium medium TaxID=97028 RepID=A0A392PAE1_9FABA|nr:hypothetical protein [Trifolium medium]
MGESAVGCAQQDRAPQQELQHRVQPEQAEDEQEHIEAKG